MADFYTGGNIYWREGRKKWVGVVHYKDENGEWKPKSKSFTDKKRESHRMFEEWKAELNRKVIATSNTDIEAPAYSKTVRDRIEEYLAHLETEVDSGNMERTTLVSKTRGAKLYIFKEPVASKRYASVTKQDIQDWLQGLRDRGIKNNTIRGPYSTFKQTYMYDVEKGNIPDTPFRFLKMPAHDSRPINYAKESAVRTFFEAMGSEWERRRGNPYILAYYMAMLTAMRTEEICGLRWKDISFRRREIIVSRAIGDVHGGKPYVKVPKTPTSNRAIPIVDSLMELLKDRMKVVCAEEGCELPDGDWFVIGDRDKFRRPGNIGTAFYRFTRKFGIKGSDGRYVTMHGLRDTMATIAVQNNDVDIKTLSALLGHKDIITTLNLYVGYGDENVRREGMTSIEKTLARMAKTPKVAATKRDWEPKNLL